MLEIHPSARKHGIADEDIEHAVNHAMAIDDIEHDDIRLYLGPARNAELLEVFTIPRGGGELAIHAMRMRPKYRHLLPEH